MDTRNNPSVVREKGFGLFFDVSGSIGFLSFSGGVTKRNTTKSYMARLV